VSATNIDFVRRYFDAWSRTIERYWESPGSFAEAVAAGTVTPEAVEWLGLIDPVEFSWRPVFSPQRLHGLAAGAAAWDEWLEAAGDYRLGLGEVTDLGHDKVLAVIEASLEGRSTRIHVNAPIYAVITLRDGLIVAIDEYRERSEALAAAAGQSQGSAD
jgi:ketosteroid isomerase-like protein